MSSVQRLSEPLRQFSSAQVREKLRRLWSSHGQEGFDGRDWRIIYKHGSSCLMSSEDPGQADRVAHRSGVIKMKWMERYLKSPRKTRAGSHLSQENHPPPRSSRTANPSSSIAHSRRRGQKLTGQHPLRQRCKESDTSSMSSQQSITSPIKVESTQIERILPSVADSTSEKPSSHKDSSLSGSPEPEVYGTPSAKLSPFSDRVNNGYMSLSGTTTSSSLIERISGLENELKTLRNESALEIDFWKANYLTVIDENRDLEKRRNALSVKLGALIEKRAQLTINDFLKSQTRIDVLEKQIDSQRQVQNLKRRVGLDVERLMLPGISKLMQNTNFHLHEILKWGRFVSFSVLPELPREHPLRTLAGQAFGFDWDSTEASLFLEEFRRCKDMQQCSFLALSGAALAQWVFKRSQADLVFDRYQESSGRCSTNRYRHLLDISIDPELARAIDLEVHTKIVEEASFEHFRKRKARTLALKLQEALASIWERDPDNDDDDDDDDDDDGLENAQGIIERLTTVFDNALNVQCRLALTGQQYECVWFVPGDHFDKINMNPYQIEGAVGTDRAAIKLTLLPGINRIVGDEVGADFGGFADSRRWLRRDVISLVQPLVWLGCAELH